MTKKDSKQITFLSSSLRRNPREDPPLSFLMETHQISAFDFDKKDEIKPPQPQIWILTKFNTFAIFSFAFNVVSLMKGSTFTQTWIEHFCFVPVAPSLAHNWILNSLKSAKGCFFFNSLVLPWTIRLIKLLLPPIHESSTLHIKWRSMCLFKLYIHLIEYVIPTVAPMSLKKRPRLK